MDKYWYDLNKLLYIKENIIQELKMKIILPYYRLSSEPFEHPKDS
jgi:hypothetical protein